MKRRGLMLLEVLIAAALGGLLLTLLATAFAGAWREQRAVGAQTGLRREARVTAERMVREVAATVRAGVYLAEGPDGSAVLGILPLAGLRGDGSLIWGDTLVVYASLSGDLQRKSWSRSDAADYGAGWTSEAPASPDSETLLRLTRERATETTVLTQHVAEFAVSSDWMADPARPMVVSLELRQDGKRFALERGVRVRE